MSAQVTVTALPACDFGPEPAEYDFKTKFGPWANGCERHWKEMRAFPTLGTGQGQKLVVRQSPPGERLAAARVEAAARNAEQFGTDPSWYGQ
jgi:hypothetical protein